MTSPGCLLGESPESSTGTETIGGGGDSDRDSPQGFGSGECQAPGPSEMEPPARLFASGSSAPGFAATVDARPAARPTVRSECGMVRRHRLRGPGGSPRSAGTPEVAASGPPGNFGGKIIMGAVSFSSAQAGRAAVSRLSDSGFPTLARRTVDRPVQVSRC